MTVALFLVLGLVLSAVFGFVDFLAGGQKIADDPYLLELEAKAASLKEALEQTPKDGALAAELGNTFYQMATFFWQQGLEEQGNKYGMQSRNYLTRAVENGEISPEITLSIAFLALSQDDYQAAEEYFQKTIDLDQENPGAHLYYGLFLSGRKRDEEAKKHWEKVLEYAPQDSPEAQAAQYYLSVTQEAQP
ncbi:MAG: hypothetical protein GXZ07_00825 [Firmicutes bacterium]|nr:hypothetical protein [Bacillota bacterium]